MNKQKLISIAVIIAVYLLGLVSGSLITKNCRKRFFECGRRPGKFAERMESRMVKRLSSKLNLSGEQKNELKTLIEKHRPEMEKMRKTMGDKMKESKNRLEQDIKKILTGEQLERFDEIIIKHKFNRKLPGVRKGLRRQGMRFKEEPAVVE